METINTVIFYILSLICAVSAVFCLFQKNIMNAVISAMVLFFGMSGLYFLLRAPYLGVAQLFLISGGIGVLMLFAVMVSNDGAQDKKPEKTSLKAIAAPVVGVLFAIIIIPFILYGFGGLKTPLGHTIQEFAEVLYKNNALSFELAGILLFAVIIGISAILINKINKFRATRLVKAPENQGGTRKEGI